jgi:MFS family permease
MATPARRTAVAERARFGGLWRDADFLKLWAALSISLVGSQFTILAVPLIAAVTLHASPFQMGLLAAAGRVPYLLVSLPAGVWTDRVRRRPLLIATDLGSALLLLSVPFASALDRLQLPQLYLVAFGTGALAALGEVAHRSYVPSLVGRAQLVESNSKLMVSYSVADSAGLGLGGLLIHLITAPFAMLVDAASFLVSALLVGTIARAEPAPERPARAEPPAREIAAGLRALLGHPLLRPIILARTIDSLFVNAVLALYVLYATRELGLGPAAIGLIFAVGGLGAVPGALLAPWAARVFGVGPVIVGGWILTALAWLLVPVATGPTVAVVAILATSRAVDGAAGAVANVHQWSLRQAVTPDGLQGRVNASHRFFLFGAGAIGALLGGILGSAVELRTALLIGTIGALASPVWLICSPVRSIREQPARADEPESPKN